MRVRAGRWEKEKRGKDKGRRRELEKISLKGNINAFMCINVLSLAWIFCFVKHYGFEDFILDLIDELIWIYGLIVMRNELFSWFWKILGKYDDFELWFV